MAREFKDFIREAGMTHVRTSPYHPQSNGKIERWHKTMKCDSVRVTPPESQVDALRIVGRFAAHYNAERLRSATGYVTPNDILAGRQAAIWAERDRELEAARTPRAERRAAARGEVMVASSDGSREGYTPRPHGGTLCIEPNRPSGSRWGSTARVRARRGDLRVRPVRQVGYGRSVSVTAPIDPIDPALRARSACGRGLVLTLPDAHLALAAWEAAGWAVVAWTRRYPLGDSLRRASPRWGPAWRAGQPWEAHVAATVSAARADLARWSGERPDDLVELEAVAPTAHVPVAAAILARWFADDGRLVVGDASAPLPLVAARMGRSTHAWSMGQRVFVHDVYWGMNERAQVVGRHRRRHGWVRGVCPTDALVDCRPRIVHTPAVLSRLRGLTIAAGCFAGRFWPMPAGHGRTDEHA